MAITKIQSESMNLADTYAFTGTVTGAGGVNTPVFAVSKSATQGLNNDAYTKVTWDVENIDSDNTTIQIILSPFKLPIILIVFLLLL